MANGKKRAKINEKLSGEMPTSGALAWRRFGDVRPGGLPRQLAFLSSEGPDHCAAIFFFNGAEIIDIDTKEVLCLVHDPAYIEAWADCYWLDIPTVPDAFARRVLENRRRTRKAAEDDDEP